MLLGRSAMPAHRDWRLSLWLVASLCAVSLTLVRMPHALASEASASFPASSEVMRKSLSEALTPTRRVPEIPQANLKQSPSALPADKAVTADWMLTSDEVVTGDLYIQDGVVALQGHALVVYGNLIQSGGEMQVGNGALYIGGDYRLQTPPSPTDLTYTESSGRLVMQDVAGKVLVFGSFATQSSVDHTGLLTGGTLEVHGDFLQFTGHSANFNASAAHEVKLAGPWMQTVRFASPGISGFNLLTIYNSDHRVTFLPEINATWLAADLGWVSVRAERLAGSRALTLQMNLAVEPVAPGRRVELTGMSVDTNGHLLRVEGDLLQSGGTLMVGPRVEIRGSLIASGGVVDVGGGELIVHGDYRLQLEATDGNGMITYQASSGILKMQQAAARVRVMNNFVTQSTADHTGLLTNGILDVAGNFQQIAGHPANFHATGSSAHTVRLMGSGPQMVQFDTPNNSGFHLVEIANPMVGAITFAPSIAAEAIGSRADWVEVHSDGLGAQTLDLGTSLAITPIHMENGGSGAVSFMGQSLHLHAHQLRIKGTLQLTGGLLAVESGALQVSGDLIQAGGTLDVGGGTVLIDGAYRLQSLGVDGSGNPVFGTSDGALRMQQGSALVRVGGSFITQSTVDHAGLLTDGILDVGGDFMQIDGNAGNFASSGTHLVRLTGHVVQNISFEGASSGIKTVDVVNCQVHFTNLSPVWQTRHDLCNQPLMISATSPALGSTLVDGRRALHVLLSTPAMPGASFTNIALTDAHGAPVPIMRNLSGSWLTISPMQPLESPAYTLTMAADALVDGQGNGLGAPFTLTFATTNVEVASDWALQADTEVRNLTLNNGLLDLNGKRLIVHGNLLQTGGILRVGSGQLLISGDYRLQSRSVDGSGVEQFGPSSGLLQMTDTAGLIRVGAGLIVQSDQDHSGWLTAGVIEVVGNFTQLSGHDANFHASGQHIVRLVGMDGQRVSFETPGPSAFERLEIANPTLGAIGFSPEINAHQLASPMGLISVGTDRLSGATPLSLQHDLQVMAQNPDGVISLEGQSVNLNGHVLQVNGHLIQSGGVLNLNGGTLIVQADYRLQSRTVNADGMATYGSSSGLLQMTNPSDALFVHGSFITQSDQDHSGWLTAGLMIVGGDFTQLTGHGNNFAVAPTGGHIVALAGSGRQQVTFATPGASSFDHLVILNPIPAAVTFAPEINARHLYHSYGASLINAAGLAGATAVTLHQPFIVLPVQDVNATNLNFVALSGAAVDLNGYSLQIGDHLLQSGGLLALNGGELVIYGDYRIQSYAVDAGGTITYGPSSGLLQMQAPTDRLIVAGSFVTQSDQDHQGWLTDGLMMVSGDFTQLTGHANNFAASDAHRVLLRGMGPQRVSFASPGSSRFEHLDLANPAMDGIQFQQEINAHHVYSPGGAARITASTLTNVTAVTLHLNLDVHAADPAGVIMSGAALDMNGYLMHIDGTLIQSGGSLDIGGGALTITGNYLLRSRTTDGGSGVSYGPSAGLLIMNHAGSLITVMGDFATQSIQDHTGWLTAGVLEVGGNFRQMAGHANNFYTLPSSAHTVRLIGPHPHAVTFDNPGLSMFQNLEIASDQPDAVSFDPEINARHLLSSAHLQVRVRNLAMAAPLLLQQSLAVTPLDPSGIVYLAGQLVDLQGNALLIRGDLVQSAGTLYLHGGALAITGDYRLQSRTVDQGGVESYGPSDALLEMTDPSDTVIVHGNFITQSNQDHSGWLTNGLLEVSGDFTQLAGHGANFAASGMHTVQLNGAAPQTLSFATPGPSGLMNLYMSNCAAGGISFANAEPIWQQRTDGCAAPAAVNHIWPDGTSALHQRTLLINFTRPVRYGPYRHEIMLAGAHDVGLRTELEGNVLSLHLVQPLAPNSAYTLTVPAGALMNPADDRPLSTSTLSFTTNPEQAGHHLKPVALPTDGDPIMAIAHHAPSDSLLLAMQSPNPSEQSLMQLLPNGTIQPFGPQPNLPSTTAFTTIRPSDCLTGFASGAIFAASHMEGAILRFSSDGTTLQNPWAMLPGELYSVTSLAQDLSCTFGGDLIAATTSGHIWRLTASGTPTMLADLHTPLAGLFVAPADATRYGPVAGKLLVSAPQQQMLYAVDPNGTVTSVPGLPVGDHLMRIAPAENLYLLERFGALWVMPSAELQGMAGDLLIAGERPGTLWHVWWDATNEVFKSEVLAHVTWLTDAAFSSMPIPQTGATLSGTVRAEERPDSSLIYIELASATQLFMTRPDAAGHFVLHEVPDGDYMLTIVRPHHLRRQVPVHVVQRQVVDPAGLTDLTLPFGDANGDNHIDGVDLRLLLRLYGARDDAHDPFFPLHDVVGDGMIDLFDLVQMARNVGR